MVACDKNDHPFPRSCNAVEEALAPFGLPQQPSIITSFAFEGERGREGNFWRWSLLSQTPDPDSKLLGAKEPLYGMQKIVVGCGKVWCKGWSRSGRGGSGGGEIGDGLDKVRERGSGVE